MSDKSRLENNNLELMNIYNAVENLPSAGGDVKLYDSIANMNLDHNVDDGQLAIVYYNESSNITADTEFQVGTFPETVVLPTAMEDYMEVGFQAVDEEVMFECWGQFGPDEYRIDCYTNDGEIRIQYGSEDGVTYTRTYFRKNEEEVSGDEMDFGTVIKFGSRWGEATWYGAIGYFTQTDNVAFDGLYQYGDNSYSLAKTQFTVDKEKVYQDVFYGKDGVEVGSLQNTTHLSIKQLQLRANIYSDISNLSLNENITDLEGIFANCYNLTTVPNFNTINVTDMGYMFYNCYNLTTVPNFNTSNVTQMHLMFHNCYNLTSIPNFNTINVTDMEYMFYNCYKLTTVPNFNISNVSSTSNMFNKCGNLTTVPVFDMSNTRCVDCMFNGCVNLSSDSYANIANSLPLTQNLYSFANKTIANIGLNIENFTLEQKQILGNKGYYDAILYIINTSNVSTSWNILYS